MSGPDYAGSERLRNARAALDSAVREWVAAAIESDPDDEYEKASRSVSHTCLAGRLAWTGRAPVWRQPTHRDSNVIVAEGQRRPTSRGLGVMIADAF